MTSFRSVFFVCFIFCLILLNLLSKKKRRREKKREKNPLAFQIKRVPKGEYIWVIRVKRTKNSLFTRDFIHSKLKVTTGRLVQCRCERPLCNLLVTGPLLISHLLAPISQFVTLPATWNLQLHLGLLKKARQPKWRRCSQWRLTCPVACCKIRGWKWGFGGWWHHVAFLPY